MKLVSDKKRKAELDEMIGGDYKRAKVKEVREEFEPDVVKYKETGIEICEICTLDIQRNHREALVI